MIKIIRRTLVGVLILCAFVGLSAGVVRGDLMDLTTAFNGPSPVGNQPWVEITLTQLTTSSVKITVDVPAQALDPSKNEFLSEVYLNLDPSLDLSLLSITQDSGITFTSWAASANAYKADGDGKFDLNLQYPTSDSGRLTTGTKSTFTIAYSGSTPSFDVQSFNYSSVHGGGAGTYYAAAHVQGIPPSSLSGWVGSPTGPSSIPEPSTLALLLGAVSLIGFARLRRAI
jgi:hypothetical protein